MKQLRKLQHVLLKSYEGKLLAVRKVTQDNRGKNTAGIDGVMKLTPVERLEMVERLKIPTSAKPVRRVWIPKPGKKELRPLGIPTIHDRCLQSLFKLAMEPEWEARFEPTSYGFRPGKNAHDAIAAIKNCLIHEPKYVLDADIKACFPSINHMALLNKIGFNGKYRKQIKFWLEAGVMDNNIFEHTDVGTPQGGIISPLLANIALHGLEIHLKQCFSDIPTYFTTSGKKRSNTDSRKGLHVIRYADDFVILHSSREVVCRCAEETQKFLSIMGLKLSETKTRLTHTLVLKENDTKELGFDGIVGFNFLGFTVKQFYSVHRSATLSKKSKKKLGYKTLVYPSKVSINRHQRNLADIILKHGVNLSQLALISKLNPVISGWARYFGVSDANTMQFLTKQDHLLYFKLRRWAKRKKGSVVKGFSYWFATPTRKWNFGIRGICTLVDHYEYSLPLSGGNDGYTRVRGGKSPFDGDDKYWADRKTKNPRSPKSVRALLKSQKGCCAFCGGKFTDDDIMEKDHIIPRRAPYYGKDKVDNLQLLHGYCHDRKTALEDK
jgi:RNA-directed DNA polymerase